MTFFVLDQTLVSSCPQPYSRGDGAEGMGRVALVFMLSLYNSKAIGIQGSHRSLSSFVPPACADCSHSSDAITLRRGL